MEPSFRKLIESPVFSPTTRFFDLSFGRRVASALRLCSLRQLEGERLSRMVREEGMEGGEEVEGRIVTEVSDGLFCMRGWLGIGHGLCLLLVGFVL